MFFNDEGHTERELVNDHVELLTTVMDRLARQDQLLAQLEQRIADLEQENARQATRIDVYVGTLETVSAFLSGAVEKLRGD